MVARVALSNKRKTRKPLQATGDLVEMRRLELLTPYMRSKDVAEDNSEKKTRKSRKRA
jgi:hypothetical protein